MERIQRDLTQARQQPQKLQRGSRAYTADNDSFGKPRSPFTTQDRLRPMRRLTKWSLGVVGVMAIATLSWLAGSGVLRIGVSMSALETEESTATTLSAEREDLASLADSVAKLEARLLQVDTVLASITTSASLGAADADTAMRAGLENKAIGESKRGAEHPVAAIQSQLTDFGYDPGPIDGIWGEKTCKALKAYQKDNGLSVSCRIDNRTVAALGIQ